MDEVKVYCKWNGTFVRLPDGVLVYQGGMSRLVSILRGSSIQQIRQTIAKTLGFGSDSDFDLKFQLPLDGSGEVLDLQTLPDWETLCSETDDMQRHTPDKVLRAKIFVVPTGLIRPEESADSLSRRPSLGNQMQYIVHVVQNQPNDGAPSPHPTLELVPEEHLQVRWAEAPSPSLHPDRPHPDRPNPDEGGRRPSQTPSGPAPRAPATPSGRPHDPNDPAGAAAAATAQFIAEREGARAQYLHLEQAAWAEGMRAAEAREALGSAPSSGGAAGGRSFSNASPRREAYGAGPGVCSPSDLSIDPEGSLREMGGASLSPASAKPPRFGARLKSIFSRGPSRRTSIASLPDETSELTKSKSSPYVPKREASLRDKTLSPKGSRKEGRGNDSRRSDSRDTVDHEPQSPISPTRPSRFQPRDSEDAGQGGTHARDALSSGHESSEATSARSQQMGWHGFSHMRLTHDRDREREAAAAAAAAAAELGAAPPRPRHAPSSSFPRVRSGLLSGSGPDSAAGSPMTRPSESPAAPPAAEPGLGSRRGSGTPPLPAAAVGKDALSQLRDLDLEVVAKGEARRYSTASSQAPAGDSKGHSSPLTPATPLGPEPTLTREGSARSDRPPSERTPERTDTEAVQTSQIELVPEAPFVNQPLFSFAAALKRGLTLKRRFSYSRPKRYPYATLFTVNQQGEAWAEGAHPPQGYGRPAGYGTPSHPAAVGMFGEARPYVGTRLAAPPLGTARHRMTIDTVSSAPLDTTDHLLDLRGRSEAFVLSASQAVADLSRRSAGASDLTPLARSFSLPLLTRLSPRPSTTNPSPSTATNATNAPPGSLGSARDLTGQYLGEGGAYQGGQLLRRELVGGLEAGGGSAGTVRRVTTVRAPVRSASGTHFQVPPLRTSSGQVRGGGDGETPGGSGAGTPSFLGSPTAGRGEAHPLNPHAAGAAAEDGGPSLGGLARPESSLASLSLQNSGQSSLAQTPTALNGTWSKTSLPLLPPPLPAPDAEDLSKAPGPLPTMPSLPERRGLPDGMRGMRAVLDDGADSFPVSPPTLAFARGPASSAGYTPPTSRLAMASRAAINPALAAQSEPNSPLADAAASPDQPLGLGARPLGTKADLPAGSVAAMPARDRGGVGPAMPPLFDRRLSAMGPRELRRGSGTFHTRGPGLVPSGSFSVNPDARSPLEGSVHGPNPAGAPFANALGSDMLPGRDRRGSRPAVFLGGPGNRSRRNSVLNSPFAPTASILGREMPPGGDEGQRWMQAGELGENASPARFNTPGFVGFVDGPGGFAAFPGLQLAIGSTVGYGNWGANGDWQSEPTLLDWQSQLPHQIQQIPSEDITKTKELGRGQFASVWLAKWRGVDVAVKEMHASDQKSREEVLQEAQVLNSLRHPSVISFYGLVINGLNPATILEYVPGGNLRKALVSLRKIAQTSKPLADALTVKFKARLALNAARGMEYLHSQSTVHFDLKADNLLVDLRDLNRPIVKIGDLGLSKVKLNTFVSGNFRGTLPWMAPELFPRASGSAAGRSGNGESDGGHSDSSPSEGVTEKVDIYSFGIVQWEIISMGLQPYEKLGTPEIFAGIMNGSLRPEMPADCPASWAQLIQECWDNRPSLRPSFSDIAQRLEGILREAGGEP